MTTPESTPPTEPPVAVATVAGPGLFPDAPFLWHALPGFVASPTPLTIVRTTHPLFAESMRLFGVPAEAAAVRLEAHLSRTGGVRPFVGPGWRLAVEGQSPMGVPFWCLVDAGDPRSVLGVRAADVDTDDALVLLDRPGLPEAAADAWERCLFYLVPAPAPYGYSLVHAALGSGRRLEAADDAAPQALRLVRGLTGLTHFDVLRPAATAAAHRPQFWLPAFFGCLIGGRDHGRLLDYEPLAGGAIRPRDDRDPAPSGDRDAPASTAALCVRRAREANAEAATYDAEGRCVVWAQARVDAATPPGWTVASLAPGPCGMREGFFDQQRRVFGDKVSRTATTAGGTGEYTGAPGDARRAAVTYVRRAAETQSDVDAAYAACVRALGTAGAQECDDALARWTGGKADADLAVRGRVLGRPAGAVGGGWCGVAPGRGRGRRTSGCWAGRGCAARCAPGSAGPPGRGRGRCAARR